LDDAPVAPERLKLSGSLRLRLEAIANQARAGFNEDEQLSGVRTTLAAEYDVGALRFGAEIHDSRAYGADSGTPITTGEVNTLELVQAYATLDLKEPFGPGSATALQAGRFLLNLGSRRLVAADDYRNTTNSYAGLRADVELASGAHATVIHVLPVQRRPDDLESLLDNEVRPDRESDDLVLWGGLLSRGKLLGPVLGEVSAFHLEERDTPQRPTRDRSLDTVGARLIAEPGAGRLDSEVEVFHQFGEISDGLGPSARPLRVAAQFVHVDIGYTFERGWKPRLSAEFDYASGDDEHGSFGRFDTLFGMRRADLAPSGLYNAVGRANLVSPGLRVEAAPTRRLDLLGSYRLLWLASDTDSFSTTGVRDATGQSGRFAGRQLDARVRYWIVREALRAEATTVWLDKGRFLRSAPNAPRSGDTFYLSLNLTTAF
jgi:hypothetical protein